MPELSSHPSGEGAPAVTSFSRKVALESEKDIDRANGLSPSPGPGAPRREQDPAAALHTAPACTPSLAPRPPSPSHQLPLLAPGSTPFPPPLPSSFLASSSNPSRTPLAFQSSPFPLQSFPLYHPSSLFIWCFPPSFHPHLTPPPPCHPLPLHQVSGKHWVCGALPPQAEGGKGSKADAAPGL